MVRSRLARSVLGAGLGAGLLLGAPATAGAATGASPLPPPGALPGAEASAAATGVDTADERRAVVDGWTPERMRAAVPGSSLVEEADARRHLEEAAGDVLAGTPEVVDGLPGAAGRAAGGLLAAPTADATGVPWTGGGQVVDTTGKVFFTLGGVDYVCSASSVAADNLSTVLTAGHCVHGEGEYATDFVFVPGYDEGAAPHGVWTARALVTTPQYETSEDLDFDVAFAVLSPVAGRPLADVVGAQGIAFGQPRGERTHAFGYPAAAPYDGMSLQFCSGTARPDTLGGSADQGLTCAMTGGSSGGPWYSGFDEATGTGTATSLNSFGYVVDPTTMYGPYFGAQAQETYEVASAS
ncbi:peptidase [Pseudokineococcus marinus]|uniref:Peptidase n=1 Tax=Pseudokineococcus marinus TaxID=351215 RepID=A0A849BMI7_9ACTN|nr:peptidase [Pseudokineococcus marinus]